MSGREGLEWEVKWNYAPWGAFKTTRGGKPKFIQIERLLLHVRSSTEKPL